MGVGISAVLYTKIGRSMWRHSGCRGCHVSAAGGGGPRSYLSGLADAVEAVWCGVKDFCSAVVVVPGFVLATDLYNEEEVIGSLWSVA
jgi:hypothetical protein